MDAIPERRVGFLKRFELQRNTVEGIKFAVKIERLRGQSLHHEFDTFVVHSLRVFRLAAVQSDLNRGCPSAEPDLEPAAAKLIEHRNFFYEPQRIVERQRIDERTEMKPPCALG